MENLEQRLTYLLNNEKDILKIRKEILEYHPYDLANAFLELDVNTRHRLYEILDSKEMADIIEYIEDTEKLSGIFEEMDRRYGAAILDEMEVDDAADVLNESEFDEKDEYLKLLDKESRDELRALASHDENQAGSIMTTNYISINALDDVKDAMKTLTKEANETEVIDPLLVVNKGKLVGILSLKDLIIARSPKLINDIMNDNFISVNVNDDIETASKKINEYSIYAMPVIDNEGILKGIITMDDALDVIEDEATEDYGKLAMVGSDIDENKSILKSLKVRIPWLSILLLLSLLVASAVKSFEDVLDKVTLLAFFQTMVLDMAGNAGTQSLATAVRGLSNNDIDSKKKVFKHLFKEIRIGLINGVIIGLSAFLIAFVYINSFKHDPYALRISIVIGISMGIALIFSGFFGAVMPIFFHKIKVDPAVASGPFISTLNDILSVIIYFSLAKIILAFLL